MGKGLTPLEALNELRNNYVPVFNSRRMGKQQVVKSFAIIENALKELEEYKKCIDLKEAQFISTHNMSVVDTETFNQLVKNSQALEIIKEKRIDVATLLDCHNVEEYNRWVDIRSHYSYQPLKLTQEEWELLKEVLGND